MSRTKKNRTATIVLVAALLAGTAAPAHAAGGWWTSLWGENGALIDPNGLGIWKWLVGVWAEHGVDIDPNGRAGVVNAWAENGALIDPDGAPRASASAGTPGHTVMEDLRQ